MTCADVELEQWRLAEPGEPGPFDDTPLNCPLLKLVAATSAVEKVGEHVG